MNTITAFKAIGLAGLFAVGIWSLPWRVTSEAQTDPFTCCVRVDGELINVCWKNVSRPEKIADKPSTVNFGVQTVAFWTREGVHMVVTAPKENLTLE